VGEFVVVANRLPVSLEIEEGQPHWTASPGGLVAALAPLFRERRAVWVGWPGVTGDAPTPAEHDGIGLSAVSLSAVEHEEFYDGFANATLWPLYHDAIRPPAFHREWWHAYVAVNDRYAQTAASVAAPGAVVWVHDYHLQLVPRLLRVLRPDLGIGFFLHIPFPPRELFMQLPWRREIVDGLLGADVVGFQVPGAAQNFSRLARSLAAATGTDTTLSSDGRAIRVGAYPISIDVAHIEALTADAAVQQRAVEIREQLGSPETVLLGVDRLDYTKGIARRIRAAGELYAAGILSTPRHMMVQIAVPSREDAPHYQEERDDIERLVGEINGELAVVGHPAVHYLHRSVPFDELVAFYLAADVMLVTPLRDGMNLVAKEYVATRVDSTGVLVLSEFAGAARELQAAIIVNPHDLDGLKSAITHAITITAAEAKGRMRRLRRTVRHNDVHAWARSFLADVRH
jgi:trehalose 6-phosphate synthase